MRLASSAERVPGSGVRRIFNLARSRHDVVNLALGEPAADTPEHIKQAAVAAIHGGATHYTPNAGIGEFRKAAAAKLRRENQLDVDPETELMATPGGMGGLWLALRAAVEPGDSASHRA
ncbi:aminotransferase class I/II-fold pyridoxal phosphate-dependent enzyme [Verrucomicrobiota bacterium]